jgi:uncharacterized membrane protein
MYGQQMAYHRPAPVNVDSHLTKAILSVFCCCIPFTIVAIVYAAMSSSKASAGDAYGAADCADKADTWANWAIGIGSVLWVFRIISLIASFSNSSHHY